MTVPRRRGSPASVGSRGAGGLQMPSETGFIPRRTYSAGRQREGEGEPGRGRDFSQLHASPRQDQPRNPRIRLVFSSPNPAVGCPTSLGSLGDGPSSLGDAELLLWSRVPVAIFLLPPPPPRLQGLRRGRRQSQHSLCSPRWTEVLQVPFLVKSLCLESTAEQSLLAAAAPLPALGAVEVPGQHARNAPSPQRRSSPGPRSPYPNPSPSPASGLARKHSPSSLPHQVPLGWGLVAALLLCSFEMWHVRNGQKPWTDLFLAWDNK